MEDLSIAKVAPFPGSRRLLHTKDGIIFAAFKNDLIVLSPQSNNHSSTISNKLGDYFSILRMTGSLNKNENALRNYLAVNSSTRLGEARQHTSANGIKVTHLSVSDSGISTSKSCMLLVVTDTLNGLLLKFEEGALNTVDVINDKIVSSEELNVNNILSASDFSKLRIRNLEWLKGISHKLIDSPIWPMIPGSMFVMLSESNTGGIYQVNNVEESLEKIFEFELGFEDDEYSLECDISEWDYSDFEQDSQIHGFITIITNHNRILFKKLTYQLSSLEFHIEDLLQSFTFDESIVLHQSVKSANEKITMLICFANSIKVIGLNSKLNYEIEVNTHILIESMTYFNDFAQENEVHFLFSNTFGYLSHLVFNTDKQQYQFKEYNYFLGIEDETLPIFKKLNELNIDSKEKYVIDSLTTDPTGTFIEFTYYNINFTTKIDFLSIKRDPIMFSVVKAQTEKHLDFENVNFFNSLQTSPPYLRSMHQLELSLKNGGNSIARKTTAEDPKIKLEEGLEEGEEEELFMDGSSYKSISEAMFLNPKLENLRIESARMMTLLTKETRLKILKTLAAKVVSMVQTGELQTSSEYDMLMFLQYCKLLGKNTAPGTVCKLKVAYMDDLEETFSVDDFEIGEDGGLPSKIMSHEGHIWSVCEVTMLPILSPNVRSCSNCQVKCNTNVNGNLMEAVLSSLPMCIYCGGRFL